MNINFEAAIQYINLGNYEAAEKHLNKAIDEEKEKHNESAVAEYRCVLAEFLVNLGRKQEARGLFDKVVAYCNESSTLPEQRSIAMAYIRSIDMGLPMPNEMHKTHGSLPIVEKPMQNRSFIAKQMNKRK